MDALGTEVAKRVLAACQAGLAETAAAVERGLDGKFQVSPPPQVDRYDPQSPFEAWRRPGVLLTIAIDGGSALMLLSGVEGLIPAWCVQPDATGQSRLRTLAQELATHLLPDEFSPDDCHAYWVNDLAAAVAERRVAAGSPTIHIPLSDGQHEGVLSLVWTTNSGAVEGATARPSASAQEPTDSTATRGAGLGNRPKRIQYERIEDALPYLPVYSRSLLKIKVPVRVTLASTKLPVRQIINLAPGSLIQFSKSCEESLELEVGQQSVALGEAVKVGEKFGLRITAITLPGERFVPVTPANARGKLT